MFSITKANANLPRSCCSVVRSSVFIGSTFDSFRTVRMPSASTANPCPTRNCSPQIDEYQVTSSDMIQSSAASVRHTT